MAWREEGNRAAEQKGHLLGYDAQSSRCGAIRFMTSNENVAGFLDFSPDWFPGTSNDPSVLNLESMGLFASDTEVLSALKVFQEARDGEIRDMERLADD